MRVHELHAPVKVVQRSKGRSATAAAAYRSASLIMDERTGQTHDFTRKQGVEADALLLPDNAPEWAHDRAKLWNAAELNEKHPRAQTAREMTVSFPSEFNTDQRREAGMKIGQWIMFRYGVAVDLAWHEPSKAGDQRNHHMHALFTTRRFDENGEWAKTKDRTLDDLKKGPEEIKAIRLGVAEVLNNIAARDRLEVYVEHLSFEKRGLDLEPTQHMGPIATGMEREGLETDIGDKNRAIQARNEERRRLEAERKVVDIEIARERLKARAQEDRQRRETEQARLRQDEHAEVFEGFYREAQERRAGLLAALDIRHAAREKALRQRIAGLADSIDNANFFARVWRNVTGRTRAEKEQMVIAARELEDIQRQRQAAHEELERSRVTNLEALKTAQQRAREQQAEVWPKAVGEAPQAAMSQQQTETQKARSEPPAPPGSSYKERQRAYFQRLGAQRKADQDRHLATSQAEKPKAPARVFKESRRPQVPEPSRDFEETAARVPETSPPSPAPESDEAQQSAYEARKAAYLRRVRKQQEPSQEQQRDSGPSRDLE